jgi:hypothetical protein
MMHSIVWSQIRDDNNKELDWVLIGYDGNSKTDMTVVDKGNGGMEVMSSKLPDGAPTFGGVRLQSGRFVHFLYLPEDCSPMKRGRTLMFKNGEQCRMFWKNTFLVSYWDLLNANRSFFLIFVFIC